MEPVAPPPFDWTWVAVAAPFAGAAVAPLIGRIFLPLAALFLMLVPLVDFYFFGVLLPPLSAGLVIFGGVGWLNDLGFEFTYAIDALAVLFLLVVDLVAAMALLAAAARPSGGGHILSPMLFAVGAAQGVILADSFYALVLFMALAAFATGWIGIAAGRRAAIVLAAAPVAAVLILFVTFAMLASATMAFDGGAVISMTGAINAAFEFREMHLYGPLLAALLTAILIWAVHLPLAAALIAKAAPAPVLALFCGAAALLPAYLLMRVHPFLGDTPAWSLAVPPAGALFLLTGCIMALRRDAPATVLAWVAVASFGAIVMMVGTSLNRPVFAGLAMVPVHGFCLVALLLLPGSVLPSAVGRVSLVIALLAALALAGAPLTAGYAAKGVLYEGLWDAAFPNILGDTAPHAWLLQAYTLAVLFVLVAGNALVLAALLNLLLRSQDRPGETRPGGWPGASVALLAPALLLAAAVALGFADAWIGRLLIDPARYAVNLLTFRVSPPALAGPPLALTALSFAAAAFVCWRRSRSIRFAGATRQMP